MRPDDYPFLLELNASSRDEELEVRPWDSAQKAVFLQMQSDAASSRK